MRLGDVALVRLTDDLPTGHGRRRRRARRGRHRDRAARRRHRRARRAAKQTIARERRKLPHRAADPERLDSGAAADVHVATTYDRAELATRVRATLLRALAEEVAVVVLVILVFLLHGRSALVPLVTLPVVLLLTFGAMWLLGVPATIMSLGGIGIALGMAVDADVVALEACHRRLETLAPDAPGAERRAKLTAAAQAFAPAILTSLLITALSFLPVFAFTGETGRLLRPLALTKTLVVDRGGAGDADAGARAARSAAARARDPGVRQPAHARAGAALPAVRALRAQPPGADAGDGRRWR